MKQLLHIIIFTFFSVTVLYSQGHPIENAFKKYYDREDVTYVNVTKDMFAMFHDMTDSTDTEFQDALNRITGIKVLHYELAAPGKANEKKQRSKKRLYIAQEILTELPMNEYNVLMEVMENGQNVKMLTKYDNKQMTEFLLLVNENTGDTVIWITGDLNLSTLMKAGGELNLPMPKALEKLEKESKKAE